MEVVRSMGISRTALFGWLALYRSGGWDALDAGKRGGRKPKLDARAIEWLYRTLTNDQPTQWKQSLEYLAAASSVGVVAIASLVSLLSTR